MGKHVAETLLVAEFVSGRGLGSSVVHSANAALSRLVSHFHST